MAHGPNVISCILVSGEIVVGIFLGCIYPHRKMMVQQ
jgi:hypothetical protein